MHSFLILSSALSLFTIVSANRHFDIINNCPLPVNLVINGAVFETLPSGGNTTRDFPDIWSGLIYSDFNQGNVDGAGTIRAGFEGRNSYYYFVKDPKWLNVGMSIAPIDRAPVCSFRGVCCLWSPADIVQIQKGGFCLNLECKVTTGDCPIAFTSPPTSFPPSNAGVPPQDPLKQCPQTGTLPAGYRVTLVPSSFPSSYSWIQEEQETHKL